ncbi:MAG: hypothetical protein NC548_59210 [Lachnospiraceae bacterium]|nr:hypothetical protein [Lachnospiraceae bacterium]
MKKAALIIPYFGNFPEWINLYLYSCKKNPEIDFIFFTDSSLENTPPNLLTDVNNITINHISFEDYCRLASEELNIEFKPENAYKLCDLRPWYGIIHEDILKNYEYWGYGDIDLVYGDLTSFLRSFYRKKKDVFSTHSDRVSGHFCLLKNNSYYRNLAFEIPNWKELLLSEKHHGVDEGHFSTIILKRQRYFRAIIYRLTKKYLLRQKLLTIVNKVIFRNMMLSELYTSPKPSNGMAWSYETSTGTVTDMRSGTQLPYLHFLFFKKTVWWKENENYWKDGFYRVNSLEPAIKITIDNQGIAKEKMPELQ